MGSYQEIETRLSVIERKVNMLMNLATVTKREPSTIMPGEFVVTTLTMNDLYRELSQTGSLDNLEMIANDAV
jgi:hypothetical protein